MADINIVVNFQLSDQTQGVAEAGFDTGLLLSPNLPGPELVKFYASTADMADDFASTDPEMVYAAAYFAQNPHPALLAVGKRTAPTQAYRVDVYALANAREYSLTATNGTTELECSFTSDSDATNDEIIQGLVDAWNALGAPASGYTAAVAGTGGSTYMTITADASGTWISVQVASSALLTVQQSHAAPSAPSHDYLDEDLTAIKNQSSAWYGIINMFNSTDEVDTIADWAESNERFFVAAINDTTAANESATGADDAAAALVTSAIRRTGALYHSAPVEAMDAAAVAQGLAVDPPGSGTWHLKTLAGVAVDNLTPTQIVNLTARRCSFNVEIKSTNNLYGGWTGTSFFDLVHGLDYYHERMRVEIFSALRVNKKVPYDEGGVLLIKSAIEKVLAEAVEDKFFIKDSTLAAIVPTFASISSSDRGARLLSGVGYTANVTGAVHRVTGLGTVTL